MAGAISRQKGRRLDAVCERALRMETVGQPETATRAAGNTPGTDSTGNLSGDTRMIRGTVGGHEMVRFAFLGRAGRPAVGSGDRVREGT